MGRGGLRTQKMGAYSLKPPPCVLPASQARYFWVQFAICVTLLHHCEAQCASGWTYFANDGVEGQDSCIRLFSVALTYSDAQLNCASLEGHLLTVKTSSKDTGLMAAAGALSTSATFMVGCSQASSASQRGASWSWIDGTDAANINCGNFVGGESCNLWASGEPK